MAGIGHRLKYDLDNPAYLGLVAFLFLIMRTGLHKARGIIDQIHVLVAKNARDLGHTPGRIIRAEGTAIAGLVSRLIDGFLYPEHEEDLVRKLGRGMLRETLAAAFEVMHVIRNAEILEVSDQAVKEKWVKSAECILQIEIFTDNFHLMELIIPDY